jgi:hypothetical protein
MAVHRTLEIADLAGAVIMLILAACMCLVIRAQHSALAKIRKAARQLERDHDGK